MGACHHLFLITHKVRWWCGFIVVLNNLNAFWCYFLTQSLHVPDCSLHFWLLIMSQIRKDSTHKDTRMIQLSGSTSHINSLFGAYNVGVVLVMSCVQYSGSYGDNLFGTSSTCAVLVDNNTYISLSVSRTALNYSSKQ